MSYLPSFYSNVDEKPSITDLEHSSKYKLDVDIQRGDPIAGTYGKRIYEANWLSNYSRTPIILVEMSADEITDEINFYLTLKHKHIVTTFGLVDPNDCRTSDHTVHLLQEYARDGDLGGLLITRTFNPAQHILLEIFIQIANAMVYMTEEGIVHGDLGCRNVLVFRTDPDDPKKNLVKLTDFGLSRTSSQRVNTSSVYPIRFAAPEVLRTNGQSGYSEKSDVYSFGVFLWEACSQGRMPFDDISNDNDVCEAKITGKQLSKPKKCDSNLWTLMKLCWNKNPQYRPTFVEILQQLEDIQQTESSSQSLLTNSSFIDEDEHSSLFAVQYEICSDCNLRYTHYESHLNRCPEQILPCGICSQEFRRAEFEIHWKRCSGISIETDDSPRKSPLRRIQSERPIERNVEPTGDTNNSLSIKRNKSHRSTPKNSLTGKTINEETEKEVEVDCQICKKMFPFSKFAAHEKQCKIEEEKRIEKLRGEIEDDTIKGQVQCSNCKKLVAIKDLLEHEETCSNSKAKTIETTTKKPETTPNTTFFSKFKKIFS